MSAKITYKPEPWSTQNLDALEGQDRLLLDKCREAAQKGYAPYSGFYVGASILLENGEIITGSNQENASYPCGMCAERVALFTASHLFPGVAAKVMVLAARNSAGWIEQPVPPCGSCRQVMHEFVKRTGKTFRLVMAGDKSAILVDDVKQILPLSFEASFLK